VAAAVAGRTARDLQTEAEAGGAAEAEGAVMTRVERMLHRLAARVAVLEAAQAARPAPRKRERAPQPDDAIITERYELWAKYIRLEMRFGHGRCRLTKLSFAMRHGVNPTEFGRWMSPTDKRGIAVGSKPDRSHRRALNAAIAELEARKSGSPLPDLARGIVSHGNVSSSQDSVMRLH
jgi:BMFP domain-containing protein YqiC